MSLGKNKAFLSDDKNTVSSFETLEVVTGMIKNSSQRTTKQLSSMKTGRCILFLMEWADCRGDGPGLEGLCLLGFVRGEEGILSGDGGCDGPSLPSTPTREL